MVANAKNKNRSVNFGFLKVGDLMNVCGYVRVSSDGQTENYSIPQQQKAIRSYCKAKGWNLVKMYVDGGYTGANINRPALQELIADILAVWVISVYCSNGFTPVYITLKSDIIIIGFEIVFSYAEGVA